MPPWPGELPAGQSWHERKPRKLLTMPPWPQHRLWTMPPWPGELPAEAVWHERKQHKLLTMPK